jgi:acetyltransferase-like isoleucine patch superfamily enzyme
MVRYFLNILKKFLFIFFQLKRNIIVFLYYPFLPIKVYSYVPNKKNITFPVKIGHKVKLNPITLVEQYVSINDNCTISENVKKIGKFCSISDFCYLGIENHPTKLISTHSMFYTNNWGYNFFDKNIKIKKTTVLEEDVWLGYNVKIMAGCTIGRGSIIGAGSFVNKDVPKYTVWAGSPAKQISKRFNSRQINFLEKSKWWTKSPVEIKVLYKKFNNFS